MHKLKAQIGYKRRQIKGGKPGTVADNILNRQFSPEAPNQVWVSDITYGVPGVQGKQGCLNEPRVYLKCTNKAA